MPDRNVKIKGRKVDFLRLNYYLLGNSITQGVIMKYTYHDGKYTFTACGTGQVREFDDFRDGVHWAFTTKHAAHVASEMGK